MGGVQTCSGIMILNDDGGVAKGGCLPSGDEGVLIHIIERKPKGGEKNLLLIKACLE